MYNSKCRQCSFSVYKCQIHDPYQCFCSIGRLNSVVSSFIGTVFLVADLQELNIPEQEVEALLVSLILDSRVSGHIDQVNQLLELGDKTKGMKKYIAVNKWTSQLGTLHQTVVNKIC